MTLSTLHETAAPWEVAWTFFPFVGFLFSLWLIWDCVKDLRATREDSDAEVIDFIAARQAIRNEAIICSILVLLVLAGVMALFSPPVTQGITSTGRAVTFVFVVIAFLLPIKSLLNRYDRHRIVVIYRQNKKQAGC